MEPTAFNILVGIALALAIVSLIPKVSSWPLCPIAVLLVCVALLVKK